MKKLMELLFFNLLILRLLACSGDDEVKTFTLTITDGTGSGVYPVGESITITAQAPPEGKEFDQWGGDFYLWSVLSPTEGISPTLSVVSLTLRQLDSSRPRSCVQCRTA